jgi:hypothetical protein
MIVKTIVDTETRDQKETIIAKEMIKENVAVESVVI